MLDAGANPMTAAEHKKPTIQPPPASLLTLDEAAAVAGMSASTFKRLNRVGRVGPQPVRFSARLVRWSRPELEAWIAAACPTRKAWAEQCGGGR